MYIYEEAATKAQGLRYSGKYTNTMRVLCLLRTRTCILQYTHTITSHSVSSQPYFNQHAKPADM